MREILKIPSSFVRLWDGGWVECLCVRSWAAGGGGGDDDNDTDGEESLQGEEGGFQRHQTNSQFFSSSFPGREGRKKAFSTFLFIPILRFVAVTQNPLKLQKQGRGEKGKEE